MQALLSITEAARVSGKSRATLHRHIKKGKLNTTIDSAGIKCIDAAELLRVYGELQNVTSETDKKIHDNTASYNEKPPDATREELELSNMMLHERLREATARETFYQEQIKSLIDQLSAAQSKMLALEAPPKKGFFARLFGKE